MLGVTGEGPADSCSELQYLDTLCASAAQVMKKSVQETAGNILSHYENDEHFDKCLWLRDNRATQYIRDLFNC